jgi:hypothetical protein
MTHVSKLNTLFDTIPALVVTVVSVFQRQRSLPGGTLQCTPACMQAHGVL